MEAILTEASQPRARNLLRTLARCIWRWQERARERHRLERLDDPALADMGLTRDDVERETAKPFWQLQARLVLRRIATSPHATTTAAPVQVQKPGMSP